VDSATSLFQQVYLVSVPSSFVGLFVLQKPWKPRFIVKEMEPINIDELNTQILQLKSNLESVPVKGGTIPKHTKKPRWGPLFPPSFPLQIC